MDETKCGIHKLVVDATVIAEGKALLVRYKEVNKYDNQRGWFIPDDFLLHVEHPERGARRILRE